MNTVFDDYAREYGEFFQDQVKMFDEQFESIKREIYLNSLADRQSQGATGQNQTTFMTEHPDLQSNRNNLGSGTGTFSSRVENYSHINGDKSKERFQNDVSCKKFPSLAALRDMGIDNFRPSVEY